MSEYKAKMPVWYAGRNHAVGDMFRVEPHDVPVMLDAGVIEHAADEKRDMTAGAPAPYMTRDMQAEQRSGPGRPRKDRTQ